MTLVEKIKAFFNQPTPDEGVEERFYQRLQEMKDHPEKYKHITDRSTKSGQYIPPVSLF